MKRRYETPVLSVYGPMDRLTAATGSSAEADVNDFPGELPGFGSIDACRYQDGSYIGGNPEECS